MRSDTDHTAAVIAPAQSLAGQLARFGGVGMVVAAFNYAGFLVLLALGVDYLWACFLSWLPSVALSYALNRSATFRVGTGPTVHEAARFLAAALLQLVTVMIGLYVLVDHVGMAPLPASFVNLAVSSAANFLMLKVFVFASVRGGA
ncbi:MAG TPA: GtrA family protein [Hyphomicrobiaceae bacterium]|nr:GtrA family protein [Hyphomicrobiaceae bacterium]